MADRPFAIGARVRVLSSDLAEYVGVEGTVVDYDDGAPSDETPLVGVLFDAPVGGHARDGFYADELMEVSRG